ncbi:MAG: 30S ribosomal protein S4e [archaeon]
MVKKHLKALAAPVTWPIKRKENKFVLRPKPGKKFEFSMPVALIFKNLLKYCKTMREVKSILHDKEILIDGRRTKEPKALVGIMDTLSLPLSGENYMLLISRSKKLFLLAVGKEEIGKKVCKIIGKTTLKKNQVQLNLFNSVNLIVKEDKYKLGDSVVISLPDQKILKHLELAKDAYVFVISGSHVGEHGTVVGVENSMIKIKMQSAEFETPKETVFVVGHKTPEIKLE